MSAPSGFLFENRLAVVLILVLVLVSVLAVVLILVLILVIHCKFLQRS